ncbi:MAG: MFS transporter, partial [Pseudomonadota bacterium]
MFGSSFGQTYFISIFAGEIRAEFGLSHSTWGGIYAVGTLASAALMLLIGGVADGHAARKLATLNLIAFALLCLAMAAVPTAALLPLVIFGLRFCGQGMMGHLAIVSVGRWFKAQRGRAVSVVSSGYSVGEAILPVTFVFLMVTVGWRGAWVAAALLILLFIPLLRRLLSTERAPQGLAEADQSLGMGGHHWTRGQAVGHWLFWACIPGLLAHPIFGTAFFFQQVHMVEQKGWALESFAALFPLYTAASIAALFAGGALVDRLGVGRIMPFYLLP